MQLRSVCTGCGHTRDHYILPCPECGTRKIHDPQETIERLTRERDEAALERDNYKDAWQRANGLLEATSHTEKRLSDEAHRLREAIEAAPHTKNCSADLYLRERMHECTCWKRAALTEPVADPSGLAADVAQAHEDAGTEGPGLEPNVHD